MDVCLIFPLDLAYAHSLAVSGCGSNSGCSLANHNSVDVLGSLVHHLPLTVLNDLN